MTNKETVLINKDSWTTEGGITYSVDPIPKFTPFTVNKNGAITRYQSENYYTTIFGGSTAKEEEDDSDVVTVTKEGWYHINHFVIPLTAEYDNHGEQVGLATCMACSTEERILSPRWNNLHRHQTQDTRIRQSLYAAISVRDMKQLARLTLGMMLLDGLRSSIWSTRISDF